MNIYLKNKKLYFKEYILKCSIGKRGIKKNKVEGDLSTPKGKYRIIQVYYRKDKGINFKTKLKKTAIKKNMGWCDDSLSMSYNKLIRFPFKNSAEKLYRTDNIYDIIVLINYNLEPIKKKKGSAIFIHVAKKDYSPTLGCIALSKVNLIKLLSHVTNKTYLNII